MGGHPAPRLFQEQCDGTVPPPWRLGGGRRYLP